MKKPLKQYEVLKRASLFLEQHNREQAVASLLLQHFLHISRATFFTRMQEEVPEAVVHDFQKAVKQHAETGIPIAHLIGNAPFYGREFAVSRDVLIPRPETEELVEGVLEFARAGKKTARIVDIGTGSGIIAITLALELADASVYGSDISKEALRIAGQNAASLGADVTFFQGDLLCPIAEHGVEADIIVSNPPYIAEGEMGELQDTVREYDPKLALFAADNGLDIYKRFFQQLEQIHMHPRLIALEIGHTQGAAVKNIAIEKCPESSVSIRQDINGKDRMVFVEMDD